MRVVELCFEGSQGFDELEIWQDRGYAIKAPMEKKYAQLLHLLSCSNLLRTPTDRIIRIDESMLTKDLETKDSDFRDSSHLTSNDGY
jgi:hypothetical protein